MKRIVRNPWTLAVLLVVTVTLWMLTGASRESSATAGRVDTASPATDTALLDGSDDARAAVQVRLQNAEAVTRHLSLSGRTAPARIVELKAETNGRVIGTNAERGQRIGSGEVIVRLDTRDREARLTEAKATVYQREVEHAALTELKPRGFITEGNHAEAIARLESARADLMRAELDLAYTRIRAPFDGALLDRLVEVGDFVTPGDPIAHFVDDRTLIVEASVSENEAANLSRGMDAEADLITGERVSGKIRYVSPVADPTTRTFTVELELDNATGALPAGVTARLRIPVGTVYAQRISPALLTLNNDGDLGIKTVDSEDRVVFHEAVIARSGADAVWVSGLPENARIITVGQGFVKAGDLVEPRFEVEPARTANATESDGPSL